MTQGPACSTVTGRTSPLSSNICVMPIFLPMIPLTAINYFFTSPCPRLYYVYATGTAGNPISRLMIDDLRLRTKSNRHSAIINQQSLRPVRLLERLDLHIDARGEIELHERIHRLLRGFQNIEQALVGADLE